MSTKIHAHPPQSDLSLVDKHRGFESRICSRYDRMTRTPPVMDIETRNKVAELRVRSRTK